MNPAAFDAYLRGTRLEALTRARRPDLWEIYAARRAHKKTTEG